MVTHTQHRNVSLQNYVRLFKMFHDIIHVFFSSSLSNVNEQFTDTQHWNQELLENPLSCNWAITKSLNNTRMNFKCICALLYFTIQNHCSVSSGLIFKKHNKNDALCIFTQVKPIIFLGWRLHIIQLDDSINVSCYFQSCCYNEAPQAWRFYWK